MQAFCAYPDLRVREKSFAARELVRILRSIPIRPIGRRRDIKGDLGPNRARSPLCFAGIYNIRGVGGAVERWRNTTPDGFTGFGVSPRSGHEAVSRGTSPVFPRRRKTPS